MRLIDAVALAQEIESLEVTIGGRPATWNEAKSTVLRVIAEQPTIDTDPARRRSNALLTLDDLRQSDGDKIYIKFVGSCENFYDNEYAPYYGEYEQYVQKYNGMLRACDLPLKYYGESWIAFRCKPEEDKP